MRDGGVQVSDSMSQFVDGLEEDFFAIDGLECEGFSSDLGIIEETFDHVLHSGSAFDGVSDEVTGVVVEFVVISHFE